ncbi:hypothetical protein BW730_06885 [Tessaracoccus aquimaris]|uniref:DUF6924 domain-containing protein n=1 Tax=Tessaracoccus aquimaris TaxID=1332264 RepID=A0A1Q2CMD8_9ACTN|nr:hypothetical protein [Tessaracoccus aquimaris]AQP47267.1 hypothetical protein BW730_06885 [Tessaracoccus aquimaris]
MSEDIPLPEISSEIPPFIRTWFDDDQAWQSLLRDLAHQHLDQDFDTEYVTIIDDPAYQGMSAGDIIAKALAEAPETGLRWDYCLIADQRAMSAAEFPVLAAPVDAHRHSFRVFARDVAEVVLPIGVGATGWEQYANLDENGVMIPLNRQPPTEL